MVGVALAWCSSLQAATLCSAPGPQPDGIDFTDVSFNSIVASDCWGVVTGTATAANLGFEGFTAVAVNARPDNVPVTGTFEGISFSLTASGDIGGSCGLSWSGGETPLTLDIVAVVQTASDTFASYLFNDLEFEASPGSGKGPWAIKYEVAEDFPVRRSA